MISGSSLQMNFCVAIFHFWNYIFLFGKSSFNRRYLTVWKLQFAGTNFIRMDLTLTTGLIPDVRRLDEK